MAGRLKKSDTVMVLSGKARGKTGKILKVYPKEDRVLVEGINLRKRHQRPRRAGEKGSIVELPTPLRASKVMPICPSCGKATRIGFKFSADGRKIRVCKKCQNEF